MTRSTLLPLFVLLAACSDAPTGGTPAERQIALVDGANQQGRVGAPLPRPVVIQLLDRDSVPIADAVVTFQVRRGGGQVLDATGLTDRAGRAAVVWQLGDVAAEQEIVVISDKAPPMTVRAMAATDACVPAECGDDWGDAPSPFHLVTVPTYEGSGQVVHPDIARGGIAHLLAFTPYPFGDAGAENPSIVESVNGRHWRVPAGLQNPVARPQSGHLSDPDIVRDTVSHRHFLYYREVAGGRNRIRLMTSGDAIAWRDDGVVLDVPSHQAVSPAVTRSGVDDDWSMWTVNAGAAGCSATSTRVELRRSTDGITWGAAVPTDLAQPGQVIWHLDVQWIAERNEYWALYNTYAAGSSCVTRALFMARSADGVHWQVPATPLLTAGYVPALRDVVYRSTFRLSPERQFVELIVSGAAYGANGYDWRVGRVVMTMADVLDGQTQSRFTDDAWRTAAPAHLPPPEP